MVVYGRVRRVECGWIWGGVGVGVGCRVLASSLYCECGY